MELECSLGGWNEDGVQDRILRRVLLVSLQRPKALYFASNGQRPGRPCLLSVRPIQLQRFVGGGLSLTVVPGKSVQQRHAAGLWQLLPGFGKLPMDTGYCCIVGNPVVWCWFE